MPLRTPLVFCCPRSYRRGWMPETEGAYRNIARSAANLDAGKKFGHWPFRRTWRRGSESNLSRLGGVSEAGDPWRNPEQQRRTWNCPRLFGKDLEARVGIEPTHKGFADLSLTTWVPRPVYKLAFRPEKVYLRKDLSKNSESWSGRRMADQNDQKP